MRQRTHGGAGPRGRGRPDGTAARGHADAAGRGRAGGRRSRDLLGTVYGARVLLLVGAGDNGGDALFAGAQLARRGAGVEAVLLSDKAHDEGVAALRAAGGRVVDVGDARRPDVVVDGIVGHRRPARPAPGRRATRLARFAGTLMVAVDVPSGIEVDTGRVDGPHVCADVTVTFGTHKVAHLVDPAAERVRRRAPGGHRARPAGGRRDRAPGSRRGCAAPGAAARRPQVLPGRRGGARRVGGLPRRRRAVHGRGRLGARRDGALPGGGGRTGARSPPGRGRRSRTRPGLGRRLRWVR